MIEAWDECDGKLCVFVSPALKLPKLVVSQIADKLSPPAVLGLGPAKGGCVMAGSVSTVSVPQSGSRGLLSHIGWCCKGQQHGVVSEDGATSLSVSNAHYHSLFPFASNSAYPGETNAHCSMSHEPQEQKASALAAGTTEEVATAHDSRQEMGTSHQGRHA